jgi:hypothetical protein
VEENKTEIACPGQAAMAQPSWPPPAQLLPFKGQIHNNLLPHTPFQRHDRLARVEQGSRPNVHHLHDNRPKETVTQNQTRFTRLRPSINMYNSKRMLQQMKIDDW